MPIRRLAALFRRYRATHLAMSLPGMALEDEAGRPFGRIDRIELVQGRIRVEGWTTADRVMLRSGMAAADVVPTLERTDVLCAHPDLADIKPGFFLDLTPAGSQVLVGLSLPGRQVFLPLPKPGPLTEAWAASRLLPRFVRDLTLASPAIVVALATGSPSARARVKRRLGMAGDTPARGLQTHLFLEDALASLPPERRQAELARLDLPQKKRCAVTLILPVYNAFHLLPVVLDRIARHTDLPWHLVAVEDASSDPAVRPFLRDWAAAQGPRVTLIENERNLGFIGSVNLALARARDRGDHVVLLNSDALLPSGWASRLIRPLFAHPDIASVTPMSNDAELLSAPLACQRSDLSPGVADRIDTLAGRFHPDAALTDLPTGVGFCMAIGIDWLRKVPDFDTAFGRGYGEEVDWCQRVRALGGRHLGHAGLFVEHRGGASFGAEKRALIAAHNAIISRRYPRFDTEVQAALRNDPLVTPRLALAIALAADAAVLPMPIYLAHSLGGGAEDWLKARLNDELADGRAAIVLRVGGAFAWQIELHRRDGVLLGATDSFAFVQRLLEPVRRRDIRYSCGVGVEDPLALPGQLLSLKRAVDDRIEVLVHDYLPLSPSYTLLGGDGRFRGLPVPESADRAHRHVGRDRRVTTLADWRSAWGRLIAEADAVTVFSETSRALMLGAYPEAAAALRLVPHRPLAALPRVIPPARHRPVIGVLGNIGYQKGAAVVAELSRRLAATGAADLVLIGTIDPAYVLSPQTQVHGAYRREEIPALASRYGIDRWLIPSIWPETFSFSVREALATGLPVWCFDLGAQAEAVAAALAEGAAGGILPLPEGCEAADRIIARLLAPSRTATERLSA
ncbi:glycosyltransferase [Tabrizicola sp. J26]|uniref:glycosyltransferase n=1 Tax=Alitabrizicola rongguiensis TaxID=2909234 RepID=UPI001F17C3A8|nr:glycosyltransferase [Tabrizicola rongguiensis]MCF1708735.1 glycosyltransferase [Tabrizicola rongguiensis]